MTAPVNLPLLDLRTSAMGDLTTREREVLRARAHVEGPIREVAAVTGMTVRRVNECLLGAREKLLFGDSLSMIAWLLITQVDLGDGASVHPFQDGGE